MRSQPFPARRAARASLAGATASVLWCCGCAPSLHVPAAHPASPQAAEAPPAPPSTTLAPGSQPGFEPPAAEGDGAPAGHAHHGMPDGGADAGAHHPGMHHKPSRAVAAP